MERHRLRATFEEVPELYDRARVPYPAALFDDLIGLADVSCGDRVLEIGCGNGRATLPLAARGLELTCVELGARLAALARRKLTAYPSVEIVNTAFETWEPDGEPFDAVTAFTAWHWIDPDVRYAKSARLLRDRGALAVVETRQVLPEDGDSFFAEMQDDYDAVVPSDDNRPPPRPEEVGDLRAEIEATGLFRDVAVRRHLWNTTYDADEWIAVLETYSGHRAIEERLRQQLYERIRRRIRARPTGRVELTLLATLNVARRV